MNGAQGIRKLKATGDPRGERLLWNTALEKACPVQSERIAVIRQNDSRIVVSDSFSTLKGNQSSKLQ